VKKEVQVEEFEKGPPIELTRAKAGLAKFLAYVARDRAEGLPKWKGIHPSDENSNNLRSQS
jgi:hypothetical protein